MKVKINHTLFITLSLITLLIAGNYWGIAQFVFKQPDLIMQVYCGFLCGIGRALFLIKIQYWESDGMDFDINPA